MNRIVILKLSDLIIQLLSLLVPIILSGVLFNVLTGWMALGAAQTLSCSINYVLLKKQDRARGRRIYEYFSAAFVVSVTGYWFTNDHLPFLLLKNICEALSVAMIWLSPGLAIWYFIITGHEINIARNQPL